MSDNKGDGVAPGSQVGDGTPDKTQTTKDFVAYETYNRAVGDIKKHKDRAAQLEQEIHDLKQKDLQRDGDLQKMLEAERERRIKAETNLNKVAERYSYEKVSSAVQAKASEAGAKNVNILMKAYEKDIKGLSFGDDFSPDQDQLSGLVDLMKKESPELFGKSAPKIKDGQTNVNTTTKTEDLSQKSTDDIRKELGL